MLLADKYWVALARLHRRNPERAGFFPREIMQELAADVRGHRMFFRLPSGELRLYRPGDAAHPERNGKTAPASPDLPEELRSLLDWYEREYLRQAQAEEVDPVLGMIGVGKELWADESGDEFIRRERSELDWRTLTPLTGKSFKYRVEGNGVHFERDGRRVHKRMARTDFEKAVARLPLTKTTDIEDCFDCVYLFAVLTDARIVRPADLAA